MLALLLHATSTAALLFQVPSTSGLAKPASITDVCADRDGSRIALATSEHRVAVVETASGAVRVLDTAHRDRITSLSFDAESKRLASGSRDGKALVSDVASGAVVTAFDAFPGGGSRRMTGSITAFSRDGARLLTCGLAPTASLWDVAASKRIAELGDREHGIVSWATWSTDGRRIAVSTDSGYVRVFDGVTGAPSADAFRPDPIVNLLAFDPSGDRLAIGCGNARAVLRDLVANRLVGEFSHKDSDVFGDLEVMGVAFSVDGKRLLTTSYSFHEVRCWAVEGREPGSLHGRELWRFDFGGGNPGGIGASFSLDGETVFVSRSAVTLDAKSGKALRKREDSRIVHHERTEGGELVLSIVDGSVVALDGKTYSPAFTVALAADGTPTFTGGRAPR